MDPNRLLQHAPKPDSGLACRVGKSSRTLCVVDGYAFLYKEQATLHVTGWPVV